MSYVGKKYIIEIDREWAECGDNNIKLYGVKGFNALVLDEYALGKLKELKEQVEIPCDKKLSDFCGRQYQCSTCLMKPFFPQCGEGWHVENAIGAPHELALKVLDAVNFKEEFYV